MRTFLDLEIAAAGPEREHLHEVVTPHPQRTGRVQRALRAPGVEATEEEAVQPDVDLLPAGKGDEGIGRAIARSSPR